MVRKTLRFCLLMITGERGNPEKDAVCLFLLLLCFVKCAPEMFYHSPLKGSLPHTHTHSLSLSPDFVFSFFLRIGNICNLFLFYLYHLFFI